MLAMTPPATFYETIIFICLTKAPKIINWRTLDLPGIVVVITSERRDLQIIISLDISEG
jgi:hypothetical protein